MRYFKVMVMIAVMAIVGLGFSANVMAQDIILEEEIIKSQVKLDKNGDEYVILIIKEDRELSGIPYEAEVVVTCFKSTAEQAKTFTVGDTFKAVASSREYQGKINYNVVAFVN